MKKSVLFCYIFLLASCICFSQQVLIESQKIIGSNVNGPGYFGSSVAIDNNFAVIGDYADDTISQNDGAIYIYEFDGNSWNYFQKIYASDEEAYDCFGYSVAIHGNRIIVGSIQDGTNGLSSGSVYFYEFNGASWVEKNKLSTSINPSTNANLGYSVAISGDYAAAGAPRKGWTTSNDGAGAVFIYHYDGLNWSEVTYIDGEDEEDRFGESVSIDSNNLIVGTPKYGNVNGNNGIGAAYVYTRNGSNWNLINTLTAFDAAAEDRFGFDVYIHSDKCIVGSPQDDDNGSKSGSAYVYEFDGASWNYLSKIIPTDGVAFDQFGYSVSIKGDTTTIGAFQDDNGGSSRGSAYQFEFNGLNWTQTKRCIASDGQNDDYLGLSVDFDNGVLLAGAPRYHVSGVMKGAVYIYDENSVALNIKETLNNSFFSVYPNPSNGIFTLTTTFKPTMINITDCIGGVIFTLSSPNDFQNEISLSGLAKGLYFISIITADLNILVQKIIVE